jgi:hypothetical protein
MTTAPVPGLRVEPRNRRPRILPPIEPALNLTDAHLQPLKPLKPLKPLTRHDGRQELRPQLDDQPSSPMTTDHDLARSPHDIHLAPRSPQPDDPARSKRTAAEPNASNLPNASNGDDTL